MTVSGRSAAIVASLGFVAGGAAGWAAGSLLRPSRAAPEDRNAPLPSASASPAARSLAGSNDAGASSQMSPSALCAAALSLQAALLARAQGTDGGPTDAELGRGLKTLKQQLAQDEAQIAQLTGRAIVEPPNLPDRFRQPALLPAISAALAQVVPGAEVTSIDCLEFPCISYGPGLTAAQMDALKGAVAKQGYDQDAFSVLQFNGTSGFILTPKDWDPPNATDADRRILYRFEEMWDSTQKP